MKKLNAVMHKLDGGIGRATLKIKCLSDGRINPANSCMLNHCQASRGYKETRDEDGELKIEVMCGLEEYEAKV